MPVGAVRERFQQAFEDRVLTVEEALDGARAAGSINDDEAAEIVSNLQKGLNFARTPEDREQIFKLMREVAGYKEHQNRINDQRDRLEPQFDRQEAGRLEAGVPTTTLGGTRLPEAVKSVVRDALAAGVKPYDVMRLDAPEVSTANDHHGDDGSFLTLEGEFSPYAQEQSATDTLTWDATEITPAKLKDDMATVTRHQVYTGSKEVADLRGGTYKEAQYKTVEGPGNGSTCTHYAPGTVHPGNGRFARGSNGAKWTHNMAILSDGTFHLLPAMRRQRGAGVILTNPSMARGQRMLFNGHMTIRNGVVTSIGLSGRLHKLAAKGDHKFINPIALLKAWGFEVAPNLQVTFEGDSRRPEMTDLVIGND